MRQRWEEGHFNYIRYGIGAHLENCWFFLCGRRGERAAVWWSGRV